MKILITDDFYSAYELYEANDYFGLEDYVAEQIIEKGGVDLDPEDFALLGTQDSTSIEDAQKISDIVIYLEDLIGE